MRLNIPIISKPKILEMSSVENTDLQEQVGHIGTIYIETIQNCHNPIKKKLRYDEIFIDEGQDLPNEAYFFFSKIAERIIVAYNTQEVGKENDDKANSEPKRKVGIDYNRIL